MAKVKKSVETDTNLAAKSVENSTKVPAKSVEAVREVSLEEVLGCLINAVNAQTGLIQELLERIPPRQKLTLN